MKRPRFGFYVIGHPITLLLATLLTLFGIYRWTQDPTSWPLTAIAFGIVGMSTNAGERVEAYRRWKRAWDDMDGSARRPPLHWFQRLLILIASIVTFFVVSVLVQQPRPVAIAMLGAITVCLALGYGLWRLARRLFRRRAAQGSATDAVTLCVVAPALPVPSIEQAFKALPAHCYSVLHPKTSP